MINKKNNKTIAKIIFYTLFGVVPCGLWVMYQGQQLYFEGAYLTLNTIGRGAGIIGICFFGGNLLLSGRYHFMDRLFGGLDQLYLFHRKNGKDTFYLLSLHMLAISGSATFISWDNFWLLLHIHSQNRG